MDLNLEEIFPQQRGVSGKEFKEVAPNLYNSVNERIKRHSYINKHGLSIYFIACEWRVRVSHKETMLVHHFELDGFIRHDFESLFFQEMTVEQLKEFCTTIN